MENRHDGTNGAERKRRNESMVESFRRLDVYPTARRIDISVNQISPEKNSPRHLRKQILISEGKIRDSTSKSIDKCEKFSEADTSMTTETSTTVAERPECVTPNSFYTLELLSRTPVRALRLLAGGKLLTNQSYSGHNSQRSRSSTTCSDSSNCGGET